MTALSSPLTANALDGRLLAQVTHQTAPVLLYLSGNHREHIQFYVLPLILGHPWLIKHNPHLDWTTGKMVSWNTSCHNSCLQSTLPPPEAATIQPVSELPDLSSVTPEYHDLGEVFSKEKALSMPPHCPYDCAINLLSGSPLLTSPLYTLSRPEREAMETNINNSVVSGIICPFICPFLLVPGSSLFSRKTRPFVHALITGPWIT